MLRIPIEKFNLGGIADSEYWGIENSVASLVGLDLHSKPGLIKVNQKLTKSSGAVVDALVKVSLACSDGNSYHFSSSTGKVWKCTSAFAWSLVHTTTPAAGGAGCLGACEYNDYIYWATESRLHRIAIADLGDWAANAVEDWATFSITDADFHPMIILNGILYIGDGYYIAQVEEDTFTANALDLVPPYRVKCLGKTKTDLLVGTFIASNVNKAEFFRWNSYSPSWDVSDTVEEVGINAFIPFDNYFVVSAGINGNFYSYNGEDLQLLKTIPGTYDPSNYLTIHPNAVGNFRGLPIFGVSQGAGDSAYLGVYGWGSRNAKFPSILTLEFPISERDGSDLVLSGFEIGSILVMGNDVLVAWKHSTSYGVDKLDWSNKLDGAFLETRLMQPDRDHITAFKKYLVNYRSLPASTAINVSYKKDYADSYQALTSEQIIDTDRKQVGADLTLEAIALQLKVALTVSGNNAPEFENLKVYLQENA